RLPGARPARLATAWSLVHRSGRRHRLGHLAACDPDAAGGGDVVPALDAPLRWRLGAGRLAVARFFFAESVLLSMAGALIGLGLAWGVVRLLVAIGPTNLPRLGEVQLDWVVLAYTLGLSAVAAAAFGAIPLWHGVPLSRSLHESGRSNTASRVRHRATHVLTGGQVAVRLVLLISSGLMVRSFQKLRAIDPGYNASS